MSSIIAIFFFFIVLTASHEAGQFPKDQASALFDFRLLKHLHQSTLDDVEDVFIKNDNTIVVPSLEKETTSHLLKHGLPGQPRLRLHFNQFAGEITIDESAGRSLFYYFVESTSNSSTSPLILWLNGGPGCSSLGMGALTEIGPFGVNPDGQTLYERQFAWNKVANVLFLESPAGVGFSYSNTTSDYNTTGDLRTARDTYVFLMKWFHRYPTFKGRDFYLAGESYAGYYIPELAQVILDNNKDSIPVMNLRGIMIGNGIINDATDTRGSVDYMWSHALISDETREDLMWNCRFGSLHWNEACWAAYVRYFVGLKNVNFLNIYASQCQPSHIVHPPTGRSDPCDMVYVLSYLNLPHVQAALNANRTKLSYPWAPCTSLLIPGWIDSPSSMFPTYKRLMAHGLHILLYSGDVDACVPVTSTRYALPHMGLKIIDPWHPWTSPGSTQVTGFETVYDGLTFATILGAGHQVPLTHPEALYALLNKVIGGAM